MNRLMMLTSLLILLFGCSAPGDTPQGPGEDPALRVTLSSYEVAPDAQGLVCVDITFEGLAQAASFCVKKRTALSDARERSSADSIPECLRTGS